MNFYIKPEPKKYTYQKLNLKKVFLNFIIKSSFVACFFSFIFLAFTNASFFDIESAIGNTFATGILDIEFSSATTNFAPNTNFLPSQTSTRFAKITNNSDLDIKYSQESTYSGTLCENLNLKVYYQYYEGGVLQKIQKYNNLLKDFKLNLTGTDLDLQFPNSKVFETNPDYLINEHWYSYELALPANPNPNLGNQTCNFSIITKAWQKDLTYVQGFSDEEILTNSISTGSWAKVSGQKFNDANGNKTKDAGELGLANWTIYSAQEVESFEANSDGTPQNSQVLENGETYLIKVTGTYNTDTDHKADAKYSSKSPYTDWRNTPEGLETYGSELLDLQIDSISPDWGAYNSNHEYWLTYAGTGSALTFDINDILYTNNSGLLYVKIFKVVDEVLTDSGGNYTLDVANITGEFIIAEKSQTDWVQTFPTSKYYSFTTPAIYENKDFGNQEVEEEDLNKIVINEVYQDATNSAEWVELYNAGTNSVSLNNWTIEDGAGLDTLGNFILDSGKFAVIITNGAPQTLIDAINANSALLIQLNNATIGSGLNTGGDLLRLKNSSAEIQDAVSWGSDHSVFTMSNLTPTKSYARITAGFDNNQATDWIMLDTPNPGTNPHSHIQVSVGEEANNLIIGFTQAYGFDLLNYTINYKHLYNGVLIDEQIEGQKTKLLDNNQLILPPFYLGTCSAIENKVCIPHNVFDPITISLIYKNGQEILGTTILEYKWK